jgi:hypothetical protein
MSVAGSHQAQTGRNLPPGDALGDKVWSWAWLTVHTQCAAGLRGAKGRLLPKMGALYNRDLWVQRWLLW